MLLKVLMNFLRFLNHYTSSVLLMVLTPIALFAQAPRIDRSELATTVYEQLPAVVGMLTKSYDFQQTLNEVELKQLYEVFGITQAIWNHKIFGSGMAKLNPNYAKDGPVVPELQLSSDAKEFQINPDEPERSAKTSEELGAPILINKRFLNSEAIAPNYMDVFQILIHELGHKIPANRKNQAAIESLATKALQFLNPYYESITIGGGIKIEVLSLPIKITSLTQEAPQSTIVLVQENGKVVGYRIDMDRTAAELSQFTGSPEGTGNIDEKLSVRLMNMSAKLSHERALSFVIDFQIEAKSQIVFLDPETHMVSTSVGFGGMQAVENKETYHNLVEKMTYLNQAQIGVGRPRPDSFRQVAWPQLSGWRYDDKSESHRVTSVKNHGEIFLVEITNPKKIRKPFLKVQNPEGFILVPGKKTSNGKLSANYEFKIPEGIASAEVISIAEVVFNGNSQIPLPQVYKLDRVKSTTKSAELSLEKIFVFDGTEWKPYNGDLVLEVPKGPVRFRAIFKGEAAIAQIRIAWNKGSSLYWDTPDQVFGTHAGIDEEVIRDFKKIETPSSGDTTYEFISHEVTDITLPETAKPTIGAFDSGRRLPKQISFTSSDLRSYTRRFSPYMKIFNREYLKIPTRVLVGSCKGLF